MAKPKKKLTPAQKKAKRERKRKYKIVFMNGKQVRVKREPTVDGLPIDEFIARNADPIWLHQNGLWELMPTEDGNEDMPATKSGPFDDDGEIPF